MGFDFLLSTVQVNQEPDAPPTGSLVNPTRFQWDDPNNPGKKIKATVSVWQITTSSGPWVPNGTGYTAKLVASSPAGSSVSAPSAPFTIDRPEAPALPTGFSALP